mgnify:CR=1 FL=1
MGEEEVICDKTWTGCYSKSYDLATEESTSHPAKVAFGLAFRIIEHLEELGLLKEDNILINQDLLEILDKQNKWCNCK